MYISTCIIYIYMYSVYIIAQIDQRNRSENYVGTYILLCRLWYSNNFRLYLYFADHIALMWPELDIWSAICFFSKYDELKSLIVIVLEIFSCQGWRFFCNLTTYCTSNNNIQTHRLIVWKMIVQCIYRMMARGPWMNFIEAI